jgi:hypothetical protein
MRHKKSAFKASFNDIQKVGRTSDIWNYYTFQ